LTSRGNTIFVPRLVADVASPVEFSGMAKDDVQSKAAMAIRVSLVIG
jgi:hypothetical protein